MVIQYKRGGYLLISCLLCFSNVYAADLSESNTEKSSDSCENTIKPDNEGLCQSVFIYDENNNFLGIECPDPISPCADQADFKNLGKKCSNGKTNTRCESFGIYVCDESTGQIYCNAEEIAEEVEICDGIDNNCDGIVDNIEGYGEECTGDTVGFGVCANNKGKYQCIDGKKTCFVKANNEYSSDETCDNIYEDNDCDGEENDNPAECGLVSCDDAKFEDLDSLFNNFENAVKDQGNNTSLNTTPTYRIFNKFKNTAIKETLYCIKNPNIKAGQVGKLFTNYADIYWNNSKSGLSGTQTREQLDSLMRTGSGIHNKFGTYGNDNKYSTTEEKQERVTKIQNDSESCFICAEARNNGCFSPETLITLADGSQKYAKEIAVGDKLFNPITRSAITVKRVIEGPEPIGLVNIKFEDGELKVSQDHPMLTANGLKPAKNLKAGDTIFNGDNAEVTVESVEILPVEEGQWVVNFLLEGADMSKSENRMLLSDGIITGDLQTQLELITIKD